jgi:hypothetical protein
MRKSSICDSSTAMWSAAVRDVGGRGRALKVPVVAVLKVEAELGDGGLYEDGEDMLWILAVPGESVTGDVGSGTGSGVRSAWGMGRRRLRMEEAAVAAEMGSVTAFCFGGVVVGRFGGDGGGEC